MPAVDVGGGAAVVGLLVSLSVLLVRSLISGGAATARRYEAELDRLRADSERELVRVRAERDQWRERYLSEFGSRG